MNFLRVGDTFYIPTYGNPETDQRAQSELKGILNAAGITQHTIVEAPDCTELATLGGVLNCITTHIYS